MQWSVTSQKLQKSREYSVTFPDISLTVIQIPAAGNL